MQAVILAAGGGKRLGPVSLKVSKAMAPVVGKPMVERVMENLRSVGIDDFILVVSREDDRIINHFANESMLRANVRFAYQEKRLGTADALRAAADHIKSDFILASCDNLFEPLKLQRLIKFHRSQGNNATLSLKKVGLEEIDKHAVVEMKNAKVVRIIEKPSPEEAPTNVSSQSLYAFKPLILDYLPEVGLSPRGEYEITDAIGMLIERNDNVRGVYVSSRFHLTTALDLIEINKHYLVQNHEKAKMGEFEMGGGVELIQPVAIGRGTVIKDRCRIGPYVYIDRDCYISSDVKIRDSVMINNSFLGEGSVAINRVVA
jgi:NDP-sugar pyrophosphorylase family protein